MALPSDVIMHVLKLHRSQSEFETEHEPSAADFASGDGESFFIGLGGGGRSRRSKSDPRECIMT